MVVTLLYASLQLYSPVPVDDFLMRFHGTERESKTTQRTTSSTLKIFSLAAMHFKSHRKLQISMDWRERKSEKGSKRTKSKKSLYHLN